MINFRASMPLAVMSISSSAGFTLEGISTGLGRSVWKVSVEVQDMD